jgi:GNAT superfamily N-acetyltransferase
MEETVMDFDEYEIRHYHPEFYLQVIDLLKYLLGSDDACNQDYFKWKYNDNPYTERPLGVMALYQGEVVGFRGYFATRFGINEKNDEIISLCPGDTCVHPDHRRKGLSVAMGNKAAHEYTGKYPFFLNLTSTKISLPGYLKMGFLPLASKTYLTKCNSAGLVRYLFHSKRQCVGQAKKIPFGTFDDIIVSQQPRPEAMHALVERQVVPADKIVLYQDKRYFRWRFSNKHNQYVFLYRMKNNILSGYAVIRMSSNKRRGFIVDYARTDEDSIEKILKFIIKAGCFDVLSIYRFSLVDDINRTVRYLGFKTVSLFRAIEKKISGELPLLLRPVKQNYRDQDFFVEGLDLRNIENWHIKGICSDDA